MTLKSSQSATPGLTLDLRSLDRLKANSGTQPSGQIKEVAKQLEGLFMQELVKSMRATTMQSGMLDNQATEMGTNMLDSQLSSQLTGLPGGLSDVIARQLERQLGGKAEAPRSALEGMGDLKLSDMPEATATATVEDMLTPGSQARPVARKPEQPRHIPDTSHRVSALAAEKRVATSVASATSPAAPAASSTGSAPANAGKLSASQQFITRHHEAARAAEQATGIAASNILGQAALESGWGKHEIRMKDGSPSHNLFGIKATADWKGKVAEVTTTEYIGGVARRVTAKFRAYESYEAAFKDHARLLSQSPRYSQTVAQADTAQGYARGLQKAGYATDPAYADKLTRVINTTLRLQRTVT
jgi:flagellar protein FlgJ